MLRFSRTRSTVVLLLILTLCSLPRLTDAASATGVSAASAAPASKHTKRPPPARHLSGTLSQQIATLLADPAAAQASWGISVTTLEGNVLYSLNDDKYFAPASNAKLLTTAAAFALLPMDLRLTTRVDAVGDFAYGRLIGDLVLVGNGDSNISGRVLPWAGKNEKNENQLAALDTLADQAVAAGLKSVSGEMLGDDTYFTFERYGSGWAWDDLQWEYGAPVSALTVNDNVIYLDVLPGAAAGDPVTFTWRPNIAYYTIQSSVRTTEHGPKPSIGVERAPGSKVVRLWGTLPAETDGAHLALALEDPAEFAAAAFREKLIARGVTFGGAARARHRFSTTIETAAPAGGATEIDGAAEVGAAEHRSSLPAAGLQGAEIQIAEPATPPPTRTLATHLSAPLSEDLTITNKVSQNLHAELLLNTLGMQGAISDNPGRSDGVRAVKRFLASAGVANKDVLLRDGSGLSGDDLVTPRAFTTLLRYAARQSWGEAYRATLPIGGVDGSLNGRFLQPPLKGKIFAKTGTLLEITALSGYLTAASGKTVVFSILCNRHLPGAAAGRSTVDRIAEAIASTN